MLHFLGGAVLAVPLPGLSSSDLTHLGEKIQEVAG